MPPKRWRPKDGSSGQELAKCARPSIEEKVAGSAVPLRILVTGPPGIGKTTLCSKVYELLSAKMGAGTSIPNLAGFVGTERRDKGKRVGFDLVTLDGKCQAPLASIGGPKTGATVGRYNVQVADLEGLTFPILDNVLSAADDSDAEAAPRALIFDEIGKMELFSNGFVRRVRQVLTSSDTSLHVLGTVAVKGGGFIAESKALPGVEVLEIDEATRDGMCQEVFARLLAALQPATAAVDADGHRAAAPEAGCNAADEPRPAVKAASGT